MLMKTKSVSVMLLALLCLHERPRAGAALICTQDEARCQLLLLADLFDRVIQHSARVHGLSNDLHSKFEQYFLPSRNQIGRANRKCHTSTILTPNSKENAQRLAREELTMVILNLLAAWQDPLSQFHQSMSHHKDFNTFSGNKALEIRDMVHRLSNGVEKVAEKMQLLGMLRNTLSGVSSAQAQVPRLLGRESRSMSDYQLLHCFRRDSDKVQNYLKILKCRIVPEHGC